MRLDYINKKNYINDCFKKEKNENIVNLTIRKINGFFAMHILKSQSFFIISAGKKEKSEQEKTQDLYIPDTSTLISAVTTGALAGALDGTPLGPVGMVSGAIAGGTIAAVGVIVYDAIELNKHNTHHE